MGGIVAAAAVACYVGPIDRGGGSRSGAAGNGTSTDDTDPIGGSSGSGASSSGSDPATGLPCDVDKLLQDRCRGCHSRGGTAPMPLVTYDDLESPAKSDAAKSVAILSIERMRSPTRPMPPTTRLPSSEIVVLEKWVAAGMPRGECGATPASDAGPSSKDGSTPKPDAASPVASVCTSNVFWSGNTRGPSMQPGRACISCHEAQEDDPVVWVGGTVYPTLHEPDGCYGINGGGATVVITAGRVVNLAVGPTGNFSLSAETSANLTMPYQAKVVRNGVTRAMGSPQSTGNCNGCHTENGANGAPGRILVP